jgi:hypothetical protein
MPPEPRVVPRFAAEPSQDLLPYGRWADTLRAEFLAACLPLSGGEDDPGEPEEPLWYPDRTWSGRTYVPATAPTSSGNELFGYVSFLPGDDREEPAEFEASADFTAETAERNPDWRLDLCDEVIGAWRGEQSRRADMTLVWGRPMLPGGAIVTAELAGLVVDQCPLVEGRFTLIAPDAYRGDFLEVRLWSGRGEELAAESLYVAEDDEAEVS